MSPPDTVYAGRRITGPGGRVERVEVTRDGKPLAPRPSWALRNHSPTGFEWGYGGSGPAQLALALVLDATGDAETALDVYVWFKWATVATWCLDWWSITAEQVREFVEQCRRERPDADPHHVAGAEGGAP